MSSETPARDRLRAAAPCPRRGHEPVRPDPRRAPERLTQRRLDSARALPQRPYRRPHLRTTASAHAAQRSVRPVRGRSTPRPIQPGPPRRATGQRHDTPLREALRCDDLDARSNPSARPRIQCLPQDTGRGTSYVGVRIAQDVDDRLQGRTRVIPCQTANSGGARRRTGVLQQAANRAQLRSCCGFRARQQDRGKQCVGAHAPSSRAAHGWSHVAGVFNRMWTSRGVIVIQSQHLGGVVGRLTYDPPRSGRARAGRRRQVVRHVG